MLETATDTRNWRYRLRQINDDNEIGGTGGDWVACDKCAAIIRGQLRGKSAVICPLCGGLTRLAGTNQRKIRKGGGR